MLDNKINTNTIVSSDSKIEEKKVKLKLKPRNNYTKNHMINRK